MNGLTNLVRFTPVDAEDVVALVVLATLELDDARVEVAAWALDDRLLELEALDAVEPVGVVVVELDVASIPSARTIRTAPKAPRPFILLIPWRIEGGNDLPLLIFLSGAGAVGL